MLTIQESPLWLLNLRVDLFFCLGFALKLLTDTKIVFVRNSASVYTEGGLKITHGCFNVDWKPPKLRSAYRESGIISSPRKTKRTSLKTRDMVWTNLKMFSNTRIAIVKIRFCNQNLFIERFWNQFSLCVNILFWSSTWLSIPKCVSEAHRPTNKRWIWEI